MNIFVYDPNPELSALWLDDLRKNKMIVESCQLLSTAMNYLCPTHGMPVYKTAYTNHPCNIWTRASLANFLWLLEYVQALDEQRGKPHSSSKLFSYFRKFAKEQAHLFPKIKPTPFVNCARNNSLSIDLTGVKNTIAAYRLYHTIRWSNDKVKPSWKHGKMPFWYKG